MIIFSKFLAVALPLSTHSLIFQAPELDSVQNKLDLYKEQNITITNQIISLHKGASDEYSI